MKIVEQTTNKLTLRKPRLVTWIVGSIMLPGAIILPSVFIDKTTNIFSCERKSNNLGTCKIEEISKWGKKTLQVLPINELKGARVKTKVTHDKNGRSTTTYKVYIWSKNKDIYFINGSSSHTRSIAAKISEFVKNKNTPSLEIKSVSDNIIFMLILGAILSSTGFSFIFTDDTTCSFDQSSGTFYIRKKGIKGKRFTSGKISNISDIRIEENERFYSKRTGRPHIFYKLNLVLKSGDILLLDSGSNIATYQKIENTIRQVIDV